MASNQTSTIEQPIKKQSFPSNNKKRQRPGFDFRWLIVAVFLALTAWAATYINTNQEKTDSTKFADVLDVDDGDLKINWERYQTVDINLSETVNISESGTYHLTGTLENGSIIIDAGVSEVRLVLDDVSITNSDGPAIVCHAAEDLVIETIGKNTLSDGLNYSKTYDEDITGAIYSKADLTFQGDGLLEITANHQDAIVGKDDVKFNGGTYNITSTDDAIRGRDSVYVVDGSFLIQAGATAVKSNIENKTGKGFVLIKDGDFNIKAGAKGISSTNSTLIHGGNLVLDTYDDALHTNNYLGITGGRININSDDDGIHADRELIIDDGSIIIAKSYEGIESRVISINGGTLRISAADDGINAGGNSDQDASNKSNKETLKTDEKSILNFNGGEIYVNVAGDGVDSNGWVYFNGAKVVIDGPTNDGNGALDSGLGIVMNGGEVLAVGSSGMAETLGNSSAVNSISVYFENSYSPNTNLKIKNSNDETILEHTSAKSFNHMSAGTEKFKLGETYTIFVNDEAYREFTISDIVTTIGTPAQAPNMPPRNPNPQK